jgi:hypothetical protein
MAESLGLLLSARPGDHAGAAALLRLAGERVRLLGRVSRWGFCGAVSTAACCGTAAVSGLQTAWLLRAPALPTRCSLHEVCSPIPSAPALT